MCDLLPLRKFIQEVGNHLETDFSCPAIMNYTVYEDNSGVLGLDTPYRTTPRMCHIVMKYHFFIEHVGEIEGIMIQRV